MSGIKKTRTYSDIDLAFIPHPLTGDISLIRDEAAIMKSFFNLFSYKRGEMKMRPNDSSGVQDVLFENTGLKSRLGLQSRIQNIIDRKEPRVKVKSIDVAYNAASDGYDIEILYTLVSSHEVHTANVYLTRGR
jgi:phage baseplate assembly protein W